MTDRDKERAYGHLIFTTPGISSGTMVNLTHKFGLNENIFYATEAALKSVLKPNQVKSLDERRKNLDPIKEYQELAQDGQYHFVPYNDPEYPEKLRCIPDPPGGLFVRGSLPDPTKPAVAIIGARMCSEYGRYMARELAMDLAEQGVQIISGMARGIDGIAQRAALEVDGRTTAVLGCGADVCYPPENAGLYEKISQGGGIISEYTWGTQPEGRLFPPRNRIISGLADIVLVVEARKKSGTQITVDMALEQGKDVFAVPGRVTDRLSDSCNDLIRQGAGVAISAADIMERLRMHGVGDDKENRTSSGNANGNIGLDNRDTCEKVENPSENSATSCTDDLDPVQKMIVSHIDVVPVSTSALAEMILSENANVSIPEITKNLMQLCVTGKIKTENGYYYRKF